MAVKRVKVNVIAFPHAILMLCKPRCQHGLSPHFCGAKTFLNLHVFEQCWLKDSVAEVLQLFGESVECTAPYVKGKQRKSHAVTSFDLPMFVLLFPVHSSMLFPLLQYLTDPLVLLYFYIVLGCFFLIFFFFLLSFFFISTCRVACDWYLIQWPFILTFSLQLVSFSSGSAYPLICVLIISLFHSPSVVWSFTLSFLLYFLFFMEALVFPYFCEFLLFAAFTIKLKKKILTRALHNQTQEQQNSSSTSQYLPPCAKYFPL